jgi:flagellar hook-associated protein 3 FlgL
MRITTTMMYSNYADALNDKYEDINTYSNQSTSGRSFNRASDDPVAALQTMNACHEYTLNQQYQSNEEQSYSKVTEAETTVEDINSILTTVYDKATEAANGTNNSSDTSDYGTLMETYRSEIVSDLNTIYSGSYTFGESSSDAAPFQLDDDNNLQVYNYGKVALSVYDTDGDGTVSDDELAAGSDYVNVSSLTEDDVDKLNQSLSTQVDIGMDSSFDDSTSALDAIISDYSGTGGTATNIVDQITTAINTCTTDGYSTLMDEATSAQDVIGDAEVKIGAKSDRLSSVSDVLTDKETNIVTTLSNTMGVDSVETILNYNMAENSYSEAVSMASTVLQNSIFDFIS